MDLTTLINNWLPYIKDHQNIIYLLLFCGSYFEIVIGISFFIYGELFFVGGGILAGMDVLNIWIVTILLFSGGIAGDFTSYFLGYQYGYKFYRKLEKKRYINKYINETNYHKGCKFFDKHGSKSIFLARLLGPVAWITPFLGGIYRLNLRSFFLFDLLGVTIGIGQFILAGYFFGLNYEVILPIISEYLEIVILIITGLFLAHYYWKKHKNK